MAARSESNFSNDMAAETALSLAQGLQHRVESMEQQVQSRLQQIHLSSLQSQQEMNERFLQQVSALSTNFHATLDNVSTRLDRIEQRRAASARRPQRREREAARSAAAAAQATTGSESDRQEARGGVPVAEVEGRREELQDIQESASAEEHLAIPQDEGGSIAWAIARALAAEAGAVEAERRAAAAQEALKQQVAAREAAAGRAAEAEASAAQALAEVQRVREEQAQTQAECESLRATLRGIREAGRCPILRGLGQDPVVASDGQTYERQAIEEWLRVHGTSPLTREPLGPQLHPKRFAAAVLRQLRECGMGADHDDSKGSGSNPQEHAAALEPRGGADPANAQPIPRQDAPRQPSPSLLHRVYTLGREMLSRAINGPPLDEAYLQLMDLQSAIRVKNAAAALRLLDQEEIPGLNAIDEVDGRTVLHKAIDAGLVQVALRILARPDFRAVNVQDEQGYTALHCAAEQGSTPLFGAILGRRDFTEEMASDVRGETAMDVAHREGFSVARHFDNITPREAASRAGF